MFEDKYILNFIVDIKIYYWKKIVFKLGIICNVLFFRFEIKKLFFNVFKKVLLSFMLLKYLKYVC